MPVQQLNQLERLSGISRLGPRGIFTSGQVGFQALVGPRKTPANHSRQFRRAHLARPLPAKPQTVAAKPLPGNRDSRRCGAGVAVEASQRIKKLNRSGPRRWRQVAHRPAAPAEAEHDQQRDHHQANPQHGERRPGGITPCGADVAVQRLIPIEAVARARPQRIQQQIKIVSATERAVFQRRRTGPPDDVPLAPVVLHHRGIACATILDARGGVAHLPCRLRNHPRLAGPRQRVQSFRLQLARGKVELPGLFTGLAGQDESAPVSGGEHAAATLDDLAHRFEVVRLAGKRLRKNHHSLRAGRRGQIAQRLLPALNRIIGSKQRLVSGACAVSASEVRRR